MPSLTAGGNKFSWVKVFFAAGHHCWGSGALRTGGGDGLMRVGCRCECKKLYPAPPTRLVFKLRPHFFHCSPFVAIQKALFSADPRSTGQWVWSTPVQPPQWPTIAHCLPPLYHQDLHYLLTPAVPIISALWMWQWRYLLYSVTLNRVQKSQFDIPEYLRNGQRDLQTGPKDTGFNENW